MGAVRRAKEVCARQQAHAQQTVPAVWDSRVQHSMRQSSSKQSDTL